MEPTDRGAAAVRPWTVRLVVLVLASLAALPALIAVLTVLERDALALTWAETDETAAALVAGGRPWPSWER